MSRDKKILGINWQRMGGENYEDGFKIGRDMANRFLAFMGSGNIAVHNVELPSLLTSWDFLVKKETDEDQILFLKGQKDGFLGGLSEFIVIAAYMNNLGLNEINEFNPAKVRKPVGFHLKIGAVNK